PALEPPVPRQEPGRWALQPEGPLLAALLLVEEGLPAPPLVQEEEPRLLAEALQVQAVAPLRRGQALPLQGPVSLPLEEAEVPLPQEQALPQLAAVLQHPRELGGPLPRPDVAILLRLAPLRPGQP